MKKNKNNTMLMKIKDKYHFLTLSEIILLFCFAIGFIFTCKFIFTGANIIFNSDTATANTLAREQMAVRQFFPQGWIYTQDVWTFFINIPMIFLSKFIDNQLFLRSSAVLLQNIVFIIILIFFSKKVLKNNSWILYCPILFTGMSGYYLENMFGQAAYEYIMIWTLMLISFGLLSVDEYFNIQIKPLAIVAILIFLSMISGTRYIVSFLAPFFLSVCFVYYIDNQDLSRKELYAHILNFRKWLAVVIISTIAGLLVFVYIISRCGYMAGLLSSNLYSGYDYENILKAIQSILPSLWILMGFENRVAMLSIDGILSLVKMAATIMFVFIFPILLTLKYKTLSISLKRLALFSWIYFIIDSILFILVPNMGGVAAARYFQINVLLQLILSCYYIYSYMLKKNILTTFVSLSFIMLFMIGSILGLTRASQNEKETLKSTYDLIEILRQKNLEFGFAGYWDAYRISIIADFKPEIVAIKDNPLSPMYQLSSKRWYTDDYYQGRTFLMLNEENYNWFMLDGKLEKQFGKEEDFLHYGDYYIMIYDYNIASRLANKEMVVGDKIDIINLMVYNGLVDVNEDGSLNAKNCGVIYGPYLSLEKGNYSLKLDYKFFDNGNKLFLNITTNAGTEVIKQFELKNGYQEIKFSLDKHIDGIEFTVVNDLLDRVLLKSIYLEKND